MGITVLIGVSIYGINYTWIVLDLAINPQHPASNGSSPGIKLIVLCSFLSADELISTCLCSVIADEHFSTSLCYHMYHPGDKIILHPVKIKLT